MFLQLINCISALAGMPAIKKHLPKYLTDNYGNRSRYKPHQGARERARRVRQGITSPEV